ncbi:hypothetical protein Scep_014960 [Stephania cephalantha]|uniref:Uncharacterized protein n=1 Tax=Stephania cephalantha TaxID=152367 RepID=A0AAP0P0Z0_9MAGN
MVLEQRIVENGKASVANTSLVDMQHTIMRLAAQCNEKDFELEIMYSNLSPHGPLKLYKFIAMLTVVMIVLSQLPSFHYLRYINLASVLLTLGYTSLVVGSCIHADVLGRLVRIGELVDQEVKGKQKMVKKLVLRIQMNREQLSKEVQLIRGENENFNMKAETMTIEEVKRQRSKATVALSKDLNHFIVMSFGDLVEDGIEQKEIEVSRRDSLVGLHCLLLDTSVFRKR